MNNLPIFLIGFMASGKSSIGKKLASKLSLQFVDLDREIEKQEGKEIAEIFESKGESYFRELERQTLFKIRSNEAKVIALGGGTPCSDQHIEYIIKTGFSIYLSLSEERIVGRLKQNREKRPLVSKLSEEELSTFVHLKLEERNSYYQRAHLNFNTENQSWQELVSLLKEKLKE